MLATFTFVTLAWIFFRSKGLNIALVYFKRIVTGIFDHSGQMLPLPNWMSVLKHCIPLIIGDWLLRRNERSLRVPGNRILRISLYFILVIAILYKLIDTDSSTFIYYQF